MSDAHGAVKSIEEMSQLAAKANLDVNVILHASDGTCYHLSEHRADDALFIAVARDWCPWACKELERRREIILAMADTFSAYGYPLEAQAARAGIDVVFE